MKILKKGLSIALVMILAVSAVVMPSAAAGYSDIKNHYCESRINDFSNRGIINGYPDGTFKPNGTITRAEFVKITNKAFGFTAAGSYVPFTDVSSAGWYYNDVRISIHQGYINGYTDGTFRPNGNITRQEAAKIICEILDLAPNTSITYGFADSGSIDEWARGYVGAVYSNKLMGLYDDLTFKARQNLTRAECVWSLWEAAESKNNPQVSDYTVSSTSYTPSTAVTVDNLTINYAGNVDVSNVTVLGNVIIKSSVADRTVTLKNCKVQGTINMDYGDLVLDSTTVDTLNCTGSKNTRTLTLKSASTVAACYTNRGITIDQTGVTSAGKGIEALYIGNSYSATATLKGGTFPKVTVLRRDMEIILLSGTISDFETNYANTTLTIGQSAKVAYAYAGATGCRIEGPGTATHVYVDSRSVYLQRRPSQLSGSNTPNYTGDFKLGFTIKDKASGKALSGVKVVLDDGVATATTDSKGYCEFALATNKDTYYTITHTGYTQYSDSISIGGANKYIDINLTSEGNWRAEITVVDSAGNAINGARGVIPALNNLRSSTSGNNGKIYFEELGNSEYIYSVSAAGFVTSTNNKFTISNKNIDNLKITMQKTKVEFKAFDQSTGSAITDFEVYVPGYTSGYQKASGGKVTVEGLTAGSTTSGIRVRSSVTYKDADGKDKSKYLESTISVTPEDKTAATAVNVHLSVNEVYDYTVTVLNWDGTGVVEGATVRLSNSSWSGTAVSDANGIARISDAPAAKGYTLTVSKSGYQSTPSASYTVEVGKNSLSYSVRTAALRTVSFTVTKDSAAVSGMAVTLTGGGLTFTGTTSSTGAVSISNVPEGVYTVSGISPAFEVTGQQVTVSGGTNNFALAASDLTVTFSLRFTLSDTALSMPTSVTLRRSDGTEQTKTINSAGVAASFSLPSGTYTIIVSGFSAAPGTIKADLDAQGTETQINLTKLP